MKRLQVLALAALLGGCASITVPAPVTETYRALGTEPFWSVTIEAGRMTYGPADGAKIAVPAPAPRPTFNGHRYETSRLTVDVIHSRCSDGMSDAIYADTVLVLIDGRRLSGCGGAVSRP